MILARYSNDNRTLILEHCVDGATGDEHWECHISDGRTLSFEWLQAVNLFLSQNMWSKIA